MIDYALTVVQQITIMFLLMLVGYVLCRKGKFTEAATGQMSGILMTVVMPCMLIGSFHRDFDVALAAQLAVSFALVAVLYAVPMVISTIFLKKDKENGASKALSLVLSNNGFMAVPLLQALLGTTGVFLGSAHILAGNVLQWTYGVRVAGGPEQKPKLRKVFLNPGSISLVCGLLLFVLPIRLPEVVVSTMGYLGSLNTPLAMLILGAYLAQTDLLRCLRDKTLLGLSVLKLVGIPLVLMAVLVWLPVPAETLTAVMIGSIAPTGVAASMMMEYLHKDHRYCTMMIALTTVLSAVTMPLLLTLLNTVRAMR